jgi:CRP-like cAMP-binding protein
MSKGSCHSPRNQNVATHPFDARLARWLLGIHERVGADQLQVSQEVIGQMLGVHRSYTTRAIGKLESSGAICKARGSITILNRSKLERQACECYAYMRRHFNRLLPGVYPE